MSIRVLWRQLRSLFGNSRDLRREADQFLRHDGLPEEQEDRLAAFLQADDWQVRNLGIRLMEKRGDPRFTETLLQYGKDPSEAGIVRRNALRALRKIRPDGPPARDGFLAGLADPYWEVRREAALGLAGQKTPSRKCEAAIFSACGQGNGKWERNFEVRAALAQALGSVGQTAAAFRTLRSLSQDDFWLVRCQTAVGLAEFGTRNPDYFDRARAALKEIDLTSDGITPLFVFKNLVLRLSRAMGAEVARASLDRIRQQYLDWSHGWNQPSG